MAGIIELLDPLYEVEYKIPHLKLRTQLINSGEAISPLFAEGFAKRRNQKEILRFYEMAMAESDEVISHLTKAEVLSKRFHSISYQKVLYLKDRYKSLSKQINRMIKVYGSYKK